MTDKAIKYLSDIHHAISLIDDFEYDKQMVNFRNRIIHSYDNIDVSIVWAILKNHLPILKAEVNDILIQYTTKNLKY